LIAAGHDVVRRPRKLDAQWSGHDLAIPPQGPVQVKPEYQYPRTDPFSLFQESFRSYLSAIRL
jgi:hypothetical protein